MSWNDEKVSKLKELWGKGKTANEISKIIGDVTRNSVIGKAYRLNLSSKIKARNISSNQNFNNNLETNNSKQRKVRRSKFQSLIIEKDFEPENPKQLEELTDETCKWPNHHPDSKDFYFCGRTSLKDFSYCKLHLLYAYDYRKGKKEELTTDKDEEGTKYIEKKISSA